MNAKKAAVMIYPYFSMQEIGCLASALVIGYEREITVFASSREIVKSEEGFQVLADKTFDEFVIDDYDCVILPGIINPLPALFDEKNIQFLKELAGKEIVIASISSSPMLLAKAGLLKERKYTSGVFEDVIEFCDFMPKENVVHQPVVKDGNIITAIGFAFREFAVETLRAIGIECEDDLYGSVTKEYSEEELTFRMGEEHFAEFIKEYNQY